MSLDTAHELSVTDPPAAATDHNTTVIAAIVEHHTALAGQLRLLTGALFAAVPDGSYEGERSTLLAWFTAELLPHARAEEKALYGVGADLEPTRLLIAGMLAEHLLLAELIAELEVADGPFEVVAAAAAARALFGSHLGKENDLLLPALDAAGVDLGVALDGMHEILGAHDVDPTAVRAPLDVRILGHGKCREAILGTLDELAVAEVLVILNDHDPKPLMYQTDSQWPGRYSWDYLESGPEVWRVAITRMPAEGGVAEDWVAEGGVVEAGVVEGSVAEDRIVDVRAEIPRVRHEIIFSTFDALVPGTAFVLVNDHDPKPLSYQFAAEHPDEFSWDYLEQGPEVWRVRIGRITPN